MDKLPDEVIIYQLNKYLTLKDKLNLSIVNKRMNKYEKITINFHIGEIIKNKLGLSDETQFLNEDMEILKESPICFLQDISDSIFYHKKEVKSLVKYRFGFPINTLVKVYKCNKDECKGILTSKPSSNVDYLNKRFSHRILRRKFINLYVLLLI